jgi:hypothetical protein
MSIVQLNVSTLVGGKPSTLQQMGAILSQGGTSLSSGSYSLLTQASDLTSIRAPALSISSLTWSGGVVTATASAAIPGLTTGDTFLTTIANAAPIGYNGTYTATVTGTDTFTYPLSANPGAETTPGTYTPPSQNYLSLAVTDFFAQGTRRAVYVLELGPADATTGPTALGTWITANPGVFYLYLVPKDWDGSANFLALANLFKTDTSKTYFFVTTTTGTYSAYTGIKSIQAWVEAPDVATTEFDAAEAFQAALTYAPSSTNRLTPFAYEYLNDATPYPQLGNSALLATLDTANVNYVTTAAEGGFPNQSMISSGAMMDGNDFSWWYAVDWLAITAQQTSAAVVIQGSNDPINPLWYSQDGINRLQDAEYQVLVQSSAYALSQGTAARANLDQQTFIDNLDAGDYVGQNVVNAVPFIDYITLNPSQYTANTYGGITIAFWAPQLFKHLIINVLVTNFIPG